MLVILASVVVVFAGMYVAAGPILNPILFALVLALIFSPIYGWLLRRLPTLLALLILVIGLVALTFGLVLLFEGLSRDLGIDLDPARLNANDFESVTTIARAVARELGAGHLQ